MTFVAIGVLISGVVLLSLKSSAKTAPDPYDLSATTPQNLRLRPKRGQRDQGDEGTDDAGPSSPSLGRGLGAAGADGEGEHARGENGGPGGKGDVLWEVGSVSDESGSQNGDAKRGDDEDEGKEEERRGVGGGKGSRGERRGLLDEEGDGEADIDMDRSRGSRLRATPTPGLEEVERNPFAEPEDADESFGDFPGNAESTSKR